MPEIVPFLKREEIDSLISTVAERISSDYQDQEPVLVGVLNGSFIFLADLIRKLTVPVKIDFIGASSYGAGTRSSGTLTITKGLTADVENKDVLIVEDIVDTGLTLAYIIDYIRSFRPRTVKICTLLDKRECRCADVPIDYVCRVVERGFLVGYGLDLDGSYRQLPDIYISK